MTDAERQAIVVKWMALGYRRLNAAERQVIAYTVTPGGCPSAPPQ